MDISFGKMMRFLLYWIIGGILHISLPPVRALILRLCGVRIGKETVLMNFSFFNAYHYGMGTLTVGNRCFVGDGVMIDLRGKTILDDDVTLSNRVNVVTHMNVGYADHPLQKRYPTRESTVHFKRGSYVGLGATILPGVTVGEESVVAAGAVVTKDVPPRSLVAGVPAVVKK